jgi:large subunit ribosomal protein L30
MTRNLRVTQTKSTIGQQHALREIVRGLGLRGPGSAVVVGNTPSFRGAIKKVIHLVRVEEVDHG